MSPSPRRLLRALDACIREFGPGAAAQKLACLAPLAKTEFERAADVHRLHELLCFLRAVPDDAAVLQAVEAQLAAFPGRRDLRRLRRELADTGIAGTDIHFPFDAATARWLVRHWPDRLQIEWGQVADKRRLMDRVYMLSLDAETPGLDNAKMSPRKWIQRMKRPDEGEAAFLIRRFAGLRWDATVRDVLYDELELPLVLHAGADTPSRTQARAAGGKPTWRTRPLDRKRPDIRQALREPPLSIRRLPRREGQALIDLTLAAMVTRHRYLDAFSDADPDDVRLVDCGDGLEFAVVGIRPGARMMIEAVYGWLTLRNRVPVGYVLTSAIFGSSEIAFNTFETWRGGDAGWIYGRVMATTRALFGTDTFTIFPYQLGQGNMEGLRSGAWWFYQKLGFCPRDPEVLALMQDELTRMRADPTHRSSIAMLGRLSRVPMFFSTGRERSDVIGQFRLDRVGLAVTDALAARFGSDRGRAERVCADEAAARLGARSWKRWPLAERKTWLRWAPLVMTLEGLDAWTPAERRALVQLIRAKGQRGESRYAHLLDAHTALRKALRRLAR